MEKIDVDNLEFGMYVSELDRPWLDTPFLFQGFTLTTDEEMAALRQYCRYVIVDPLRSTVPVRTRRPAAAAQTDIRTVEREGADPIPLIVLDDDRPRTPRGRLMRDLGTSYPDTASVEDELPAAGRSQERAFAVMERVFTSLNTNGVINHEELREAITDMTESIVRNPDALLLLTRLKRKSDYAYDHALGVAVHLLAFGRHLGFPKPQLHILGTAGLLLDIGKIKLSSALLNKQGPLDPDEYNQVKRHVAFGIEIARRIPDIPSQVIDVIAQHHEREDGSGYPVSAKAEDCGILGKMAGIADTFVALVSDRPYATPAAPFEALQMLYRWRGTYFQEELVEQFIQCLSIYPVGTLVELTTGEVAIVLAHNRARRLRPRVMAVLGPDKSPYAAPVMIDLLTHRPDANGHRCEIRKPLPEGMYGVDARNYYL